ncbi:MAG: hypothetical protein IIZ12_03905 [Eggerthellaceae bacterium]|nr:hypothetical protein [Eggerthellaceae bacterium]
MLLKAPNGAVIDASEESAKNLLANGFSKVEKPTKPEEKPKRTTRKRTTKE